MSCFTMNRKEIRYISHYCFLFEFTLLMDQDVFGTEYYYPENVFFVSLFAEISYFCPPLNDPLNYPYNYQLELNFNSLTCKRTLNYSLARAFHHIQSLSHFATLFFIYFSALRQKKMLFFELKFSLGLCSIIVLYS